MPPPQFENEPLAELRRAPVRASLTTALAALDERLPLEVPVLAASDARAEGERFESSDPGAPGRVVAVAARAGEADVAAALAAAGESRWRDVAVAERSARLSAAAAELRRRRAELAALEVRECAKPWHEADADVCEAIDQLEYAARASLALGSELLQVPGERNTLRYAPRGVAVVISPWNFPIAIPAGMVAAALATGNAVVLKPAEQAPACGHALVEALRAGGVPSDAISLLPGFGDTGAALVRSPAVHAIAFTGSSEVGLDIVRAAAETPPAQAHVKRVVAEMGGKNCVIVDADADLDEVVPAIVHSAFAYAGQKCSAASRVLAHRDIAARLYERLAGALETFKVGQADDFATDVPPLIEREAKERVERYAEIARSGRLATAPTELPAAGWFVAPMLASELPASSAVLSEEIFGPLLAFEAVESVNAACEVVEALPFALTGGLFTRSPETAEAVVRRSPVGNLYVNREITGARVGRQPFGGGRRSGTGSKVGGADYLLEFVEPRVVCENTMRHGLAVE